MSAETRAKLANDPRLVLTHYAQKGDLLDSTKTNTWLIEFLLKLLDTAGHPIMITALNTDHRPGTHHEAGRGVDLWHADWASVGDDKIVEVMSAGGKIAATGQPTLVEVGLSGDAAKFQTYVTWPPGCAVFVEDWGQSNEHVHFAVGTPGP